MKKRNLPSSFCPLPWINLSMDVNGSLRPCCKFAQPNPNNRYQLPNMKEGRLDTLWNDIRYQSLRQAFLDGERPSECQSCWDEERSGVESFRTSFAKTHNIELDELDFGPIAIGGPKAMDLKLNNVCNLKCRICGPQSSSTYLKEIEDRFNIVMDDGKYWTTNKILGTDNEQIMKEWSADLKHLEITGGDPMVSPENIKVLELLVGSGKSSSMTLVLNTNATLYNSKLIDFFKSFKETRVLLSIDDIGKRFEYQRFPAKWNQVQKNIEKYINLSVNFKNIKVILVPTVSIYSVYYLEDYVSWADPLGMEIHYNILHYDEFHSIKNLPGWIKKLVLERLSDERFRSIKEFMNLPCKNPLLINKFIDETLALDRHRGNDFVETFEEWGRLIMMCKSNNKFERFLKKH